MDSKYKYVYYNDKSVFNGTKCKIDLVWQAMVKSGGKSLCCKMFKTEREAALHVDKMLIKHGYEPVNILKRKP